MLSTVHVLNAAPVAYEFTIRGNKILCRDVVAGTQTSVEPGYNTRVGDVILTLHGSSSMSRPISGTPSGGRRRRSSGKPRGSADAVGTHR